MVITEPSTEHTQLTVLPSSSSGISFISLPELLTDTLHFPLSVHVSSLIPSGEGQRHSEILGRNTGHSSDVGCSQALGDPGEH